MKFQMDVMNPVLEDFEEGRGSRRTDDGGGREISSYIHSFL